MVPSPPLNPYPPFGESGSGQVLPPALPSRVKKTRFSTGVRLVLAGALVALLSLGVWIGLQVFFQAPPEGNFTLPAIPPDVPLSAASEPTVAAAVSPPPSPAPGISTGAEEENDKTGALQRKLAETPKPGPSLYLQAASALSAEKNVVEATRILRDGLARHRESEELLLALADLRFRNGAPVEAWEIIARTGRLDDSRFTSRLLRFGLSANRADETLVILATAGNGLPDWSDDEWLMIVRLHEETGQFDRAIEIADRRVGNRTELFRLRAVRAEKSGNLDEAIFNSEQYLAHLVDPPASEWNKLAGLYASAGREEEASRAQRQADATVPQSP